MPRFRLSIRWMMLIVLLVALLLFGEQMRRTRRDRLQTAQQYLAEERDWRKTHRTLQRRLAQGRDASPRLASLSEEELAKEKDGIREVSENHRIWADYTRQLARFYENRASHPWEPLGMEPPIPRQIDGTVAGQSPD